MTHMETRGEMLARAHRKPRWIGTEPPRRDGLLDILDSGRYCKPEDEGTEMPKRETHVPLPTDHSTFWIVVLVGVVILMSSAVVLGLRWVVGL